MVFMMNSIYSAKMNNITEDWKLSDIETTLQPILKNNFMSYSKSVTIKLSLLNPILHHAKIRYTTQDWKIVNQDGDGLCKELMRHWYLFNQRPAIIDIMEK